MSKLKITGTSEGGGDGAREIWGRVGELWDGVREIWDRAGEIWDIVRETKAEADGKYMGEGLERASATMFSGPGTSTTELV